MPLKVELCLFMPCRNTRKPEAQLHSFLISAIDIDKRRGRIWYVLTFWHRNYYFNFNTLCIYNVNNSGTKYVRIMNQTAF